MNKNKKETQEKSQQQMKQGRKLARQTEGTNLWPRVPRAGGSVTIKVGGYLQSPAGPGKTLTKYQSNELNSKTLHSINENKPSTHQEQMQPEVCRHNIPQAVQG